VPEGPAIILCNEFFDALPVHQCIKRETGWHERVIGTDPDGNLVYGLAADPIPHFGRLLPPTVREAEIGAIFEWRSDPNAFEIGRRLAHAGGAALIIDYGHVESATGDTLQAVGQHAFADPLRDPGSIDLTAHVDFQAIAQAAESMGAAAHGPIAQGEFLRRLGIEPRAAVLKANSSPDKAVDIDIALTRLTAEGAAGMGDLFKVLGLSNPKLGPLPGFDS
jgi:SAM-dependent MidA family methyltransferase